MNKDNNSIRTCLEKQAQTELKKPFIIKKKMNKNKDSLQLNWKDAVVFSLIMVFGCGYWLQAGLFMVV